MNLENIEKNSEISVDDGVSIDNLRAPRTWMEFEMSGELAQIVVERSGNQTTEEYLRTLLCPDNVKRETSQSAYGSRKESVNKSKLR